MVDWLAPGELRIGLGCLRLSTEAPIRAALEAGVTVFDTARAYGNEELLARALGGRGRIVTKGGMTRPDGGWRPDGRARTILDDCEASLRALDGRIDLYLLHAPDPRVLFSTSVRALASLVERGMVPRVGVCNVNRRQLQEALELAPLTAIQVSLDEALPGGVVALALERGLWVMAHSPFGGPRRAKSRLRNTTTPELLAGILALDSRAIALPGATTVEHVRENVAAARVILDEDSPRPRLTISRAAPSEGEVVLIAGLSGAGKSTEVERFVAEGFARLNRDERGGTLAQIARALDRALEGGTRRVVLDNTYLTRASRHEVLRVAARHGVPVRCLWIDVPLVEAQRNVVERMLEAHGRLLAPEEMSGDPTRLSPRVLFTQARRLEPPEADEGFASLVMQKFSRRASRRENAGRAVALEVFRARGRAVLDQGEPGPRLVFAWLPDGEIPRGVEFAACTHPGGPPICWCRPPLPGLLLKFAYDNNVDPARLTVVGDSAAHEKLAAAIGARYEPSGE